MAALNKVMLIGNLGRDPEVRMTPAGAKVASFSIAVTERFKDRNGQQQEKTEWVNIVLWRRQAEIAEQYLRKGSSIYIEGKLQTASWDDPNGQKRYKTEVVGSNFQMLGARGGAGGGMGSMDAMGAMGNGGGQASQSGYETQSAPSYDQGQDFGAPDFGSGNVPPAPQDDTLPF